MKNEINYTDQEVSIKQILIKIKDLFLYLWSKWILLFLAGIFSGAIGLGYAYTQKVTYIASLSFALEDEKSGGGVSGALGLASSLGIDLGGSAGGAARRRRRRRGGRGAPVAVAGRPARVPRAADPALAPRKRGRGRGRG